MTTTSRLLPEPRSGEGSGAVAVHPPKVELFDLAAQTNTDPKGIVRQVDRYRVESFGLYLSRPVVDHPRIRYLESWLLPEVGIRVTDWHFYPGHELDQDFYIDIASIEPGPEVWRSTDYYLDVVLRTGRGLDVLDIDELLAAMDTGALDRATGQHALENSYHVVEKIAAAGYDLGRWLSEIGIELTWQRK